jgi:hypothetical protein
MRRVFFARDAVELGVNAHVFLGGQIEVRGHRLRDDTDDFADLVGIADDIVAGDARESGGRGDERGEHAQQRGLAGAVGAEQAEDLAVAHSEAQAVDGAEIAEALG